MHWLVPRVLVNREAVHVAGGPRPEWPPPDPNEDNGFRFAEHDNYRDVFVEGDCDAGALLGVFAMLCFCVTI